MKLFINTRYIFEAMDINVFRLILLKMEVICTLYFSFTEDLLLHTIGVFRLRNLGEGNS